LLLANRRWAYGRLATTPPRTAAGPGRQAAALPGLLAAPAGQAANPRGLEPGAGFRPGTVRGF
jgi:hypothetical protein